MARRTATARRSSALNRLAAVFAAGLLLVTAPSYAEDLYCEVMSVDGTATLSSSTVSGKSLQEGDLLSVNDVVRVGPASYVDLAYDRDWSNVTRIEENSTLRIKALFPTEVELESGGVFAKLKSLPKDSSFDVKTPTAIASVRGTEYRTTYLEGETQVYNVSNSDVYVYGVDPSGRKQETEPVIIRNSQKTFVPHRGDTPMSPRRMETKDIQHAAEFKQGIERRIQQNVERGRVGKLPDVGEIGRRIQERRQGNEQKQHGDQRGPSSPRKQGKEGGQQPARGEPQRQNGTAGDHREDPNNNNSKGPQQPGKPAQGKPAARPRAQR